MSHSKRSNVTQFGENLPDFLTIPEFCAVARCGRSTGYELARTKQIPVVTFGKLVRIPRAALLDWMADQTRA